MGTGHETSWKQDGMRFILELQDFWCIQSVAALGAWEETSVWGDQERFACVWKAVVSRALGRAGAGTQPGQHWKKVPLAAAVGTKDWGRRRLAQRCSW